MLWPITHGIKSYFPYLTLAGDLAALTMPKDTVAVINIVASMTEIPDVNFRLSRRRNVHRGKMMVTSTTAIMTLLTSLYTEFFFWGGSREDMNDR